MVKNSQIALLLMNSVIFEHRTALLWFIFCDESNECIWWSAIDWFCWLHEVPVSIILFTLKEVSLC